MTPLARFGVLTDLHYANRTYSNRCCRESLAKLTTALADLAARAVPLVLNLGDTIDTDVDRETERQRVREVAAALAAYPGRTASLLGNHDLETFAKPEFLDLLGLGPLPAWRAFDHDGVRFVLLDADFRPDGVPYDCGNGDWRECLIPADELAWLRAELAATDRPVIVCCHQNLDDRLCEGRPDPHLVANAGAVRTVLEAAGNVRLVLQGHYHPGLYQRLGGIPYVTLPAMVEGAGSAAVAYADITVTAAAISITGFGRQPSFTC